MADRNDASSGMIASSARAERLHSQASVDPRGGESVVTEFFDAARSAAESLLERQKRQIAVSVLGVAEALRSGAHPLRQSQTGVIARYLEEAASQVEGLSHGMREKSWGELVNDTETFARRRPTLFVLSAAAAGFVIGRLLWTSASSRQFQGDRSAQRSEQARAVTAAVSSGSGSPAGGLTGNPARPAGAVGAH
jgi:ElaB/YqjD/DUF883 family membrane-anchored ribosome-binding protein